MAGRHTAQTSEARKPINYRWISAAESYLCVLCEVMEHKEVEK